MILAIFRCRNFALFWPGYVISMIGDWMLMAALPFYVYQRTGSALASGEHIRVSVWLARRSFCGSLGSPPDVDHG